MNLHPLPLACLLGMAAATAARTANATDAAQATALPAVQVRAEAADNGFRSTAPAQSDKSDTPLAQTPFSITVVPRALLNSQQAQTLADALHNVSGVVANTYGRRGWDDLIIRGQTASHSLFVDGLRTASDNRVAEQLLGMQQVEVLKGPASLLYGQVLPGGLVNLVSKRPEATTLRRAELGVGSDGLQQGSFDLNQPLSANGKTALRLNGLAMNADDPTDHVYFRSRWIAPSLSLDLGARTDFVLLTSYQERDYLRQQGLPWEGSAEANPNGKIDRALFTGEPTQPPYHSHQSRIGYVLDHRFDNGWTLHHAARWQAFGLDGFIVANNGLAADLRTLRRTATDQHYDGRTWVQDTYLQRGFASGAWQHTLTAGVDAFKTWEWNLQSTCRIGTLNVYAPVYGGAIVCPSTPSRDNLSVVSSGGLYLRDRIQFTPDWQLLLGVRHDRSRNRSEDDLSGVDTRNAASASTGSAALMFDAGGGLHPYASVATSFYPNVGTDAQGAQFDPERGRQVELGLKMELDAGTSLSMALYDLRRRNVLQSDPFNDGYSIAVGEQRSRGMELNAAADLGSGVSLFAGYAYTDAVVTDDGAQRLTTVGDRLYNVPKHSGSLWLQYAAHGVDDGWTFSGGARAEGEKTAYGQRIPGYMVFDAGLAYRQGHWRYALNLKNVFDHDYYSGGLQRAVALGDPRTLLFSVGVDY
ncbi:TonB-dependent siderophore receptor [Xanthomonas translucens]|uniref:TonB-dependent siderophore receptor n=1 Tax=Xanthomonas campestris pv. translucens TaxID=343 RepID=UPI00071E6ED8|nr:TonB-dependent siderophore receptor [Xanthomonas translucens]